MLHWSRMSLAPGIFMRSDVLRFGKIGRARIVRRVQVIRPQPESGATRRVCTWPLWSFDVLPDGKFPVNGLTQAREPRSGSAAI